jgi:chemotaxis response regulator CheB
MYKVLVVDDESWVVESLKASLNWKIYGFEVTWEAYSGLDALNCIREFKPDVYRLAICLWHNVNFNCIIDHLGTLETT